MFAFKLFWHFLERAEHKDSCDTDSGVPWSNGWAFVPLFTLSLSLAGFLGYKVNSTLKLHVNFFVLVGTFQSRNAGYFPIVLISRSVGIVSFLRSYNVLKVCALLYMGTESANTVFAQSLASLGCLKLSLKMSRSLSLWNKSFKHRLCMRNNYTLWTFVAKLKGKCRPKGLCDRIKSACYASLVASSTCSARDSVCAPEKRGCQTLNYATENQMPVVGCFAFYSLQY